MACYVHVRILGHFTRIGYDAHFQPAPPNSIPLIFQNVSCISSLLKAEDLDSISSVSLLVA